MVIQGECWSAASAFGRCLAEARGSEQTCCQVAARKPSELPVVLSPVLSNFQQVSRTFSSCMCTAFTAYLRPREGPLYCCIESFLALRNAGCQMLGYHALSASFTDMRDLSVSPVVLTRILMHAGAVLLTKVGSAHVAKP